MRFRDHRHGDHAARNVRQHRFAGTASSATVAAREAQQAGKIAAEKLVKEASEREAERAVIETALKKEAARLERVAADRDNAKEARQVGLELKGVSEKEAKKIVEQQSASDRPRRSVRRRRRGLGGSFRERGKILLARMKAGLTNVGERIKLHTELLKGKAGDFFVAKLADKVKAAKKLVPSTKLADKFGEGEKANQALLDKLQTLYDAAICGT